MSETKHTPGPQCSADRTDEDRICNCPCRKGQGEANARLIAAAPDGYQLAQAIVNVGIHRGAWILAKAQALIAKVEGTKP